MGQVKEVWEWVSWAIGAIGALVGFIQGGGVPGFLIQVALFGLACYVAFIPVVVIWILVFAALGNATGRRTHLRFRVGALIAGILAGGIYLRSQMYEGIGEPGDPSLVDGGSTFLLVLGTVLLLIPAYFIWHRFGSKEP